MRFTISRMLGAALVSAILSIAPSPALAQPAADSPLLQAAEAEQPAALATLRQLVEIESDSRNAAGLKSLADAIEPRLKALGAGVERVAMAAPSSGEALVGRLKGAGGRRLLLMAHMDTIYPAGTLAKRPWRVEGNRAFGPGIADDKGGVVVILHTLEVLKKRGFDGFGEIVVMFNPDEETGSFGSRGLIQRLAAESDVVLSFEPTSPGPEFVAKGTSGIASVKAVVRGRAAHAGAAPEQGRNALVEAADLVLRSMDLDDPARGLRFNWTQVQGGVVRNMIPDETIVQGDVRFVRNEDLAAFEAALRERVRKQKVPDTIIELSVEPGRPAFNASPDSLALIEQAQAIYREIGGELRTVERVGGGTDAAFAALSGKPVLEGLGLPGFGYHSSSEEFVRTDRIAARLYLAARMIMEQAKRR